jgi:hypothetical protein
MTSNRVIANRALALATAMTVVATMACKLLDRGDSEEKASASVTAAAPPLSPSALPSALQNTNAVPEEPKGLFEDQLPEGLVPVDRTPVPVALLKTAAKQEDDASKARNAKDYKKAIALYLEALETDPGYPAARYNLARTLILNEQVEAGLGVL